MANHYFQFKQFTIHQERSALKVCTDSCLFGAIVAHTIERDKMHPKRILDVGAGTGLLSLMLAQKTNAEIDAVEIHEPSYEEMKHNFQQSKWGSRLHPKLMDIKNHTVGEKYDYIIANPPFYEHSLMSAQSHKNISKHQSGLMLEDLIRVVPALLDKGGMFAVLLPFSRLEYFTNMAGKYGFNVKESYWVRQTPAHAFFRGILIFHTDLTPANHHTLEIKTKAGAYTPAFMNLLKDYYL